MRFFTIVILSVLAFALASLFNYYHMPRQQFAKHVDHVEAPVPADDDIDYWVQDINPRDGQCHCAGGSLCSSCPTDPICKCPISRLDLYEAHQRYLRVRQDFQNIITQ